MKTYVYAMFSRSRRGTLMIEELDRNCSIMAGRCFAASSLWKIIASIRLQSTCMALTDIEGFVCSQEHRVQEFLSVLK